MRIGLAYNLRGEADPGGELLPDGDEEFDSPATIDALARVLEGAGHEVRRLGFGRGFVEALLADPPGMVFNIAEGRRGRSREAQVPAILEMFGIPYTGSDPLTLALTLEKDLAKRVVASHGIDTPAWVTVEPGVPLPRGELARLRYPLIVKPLREGSSIGIRDDARAADESALRARLERAAAEGRPVIVEEFVGGPELTVGVVGNGPPRAIGAMMIRHRTCPPEEFIYSLDVKRDWERQVEYLVPPPLPAPVVAAAGETAVAVCAALGCRDVARVDLRLRGETPCFIEVNPLPGLSPEYGDLVILAGKTGWSHERLVLEILRAARERTGA